MSPLKVLVTGAAGQIAYSLLPIVAKGDVFGIKQEIVLILLDIPQMLDAVNGVAMELQDCSYPLLQSVVITTEEQTAFTDIDFAFLVGAMPRKEGMERKDLLNANAKIFVSQGKALDKFAKKTVKILVVGNPANTNCLAAQKSAPSIPKENFTAMTRLDLNRAHAQIAARLGLPCDAVERCIIWGNHSNTQYPDSTHSVVSINGKKESVIAAVKDDQWLRNDFIKCVQSRGAAIIKARKMSSAMSAAKAACDHMRDWYIGTGDRWVSMGVIGGDSYGIDDELCYSYPVTIDSSGKWSIVQGLEINDFSREKMNVTAKELQEERSVMLSFLE